MTNGNFLKVSWDWKLRQYQWASACRLVLSTSQSCIWNGSSMCDFVISRIDHLENTLLVRWVMQCLQLVACFSIQYQNMTLVNITTDLINKKKSSSLGNLTLMVAKANFPKFGFLLESLHLIIGNKYCFPYSDRLTSVNFLIQILF